MFVEQDEIVKRPQAIELATILVKLEILVPIHGTSAMTFKEGANVLFRYRHDQAALEANLQNKANADNTLKRDVNRKTSVKRQIVSGCFEFHFHLFVTFTCYSDALTGPLDNVAHSKQQQQHYWQQDSILFNDRVERERRLLSGTQSLDQEQKQCRFVPSGAFVGHGRTASDGPPPH